MIGKTISHYQIIEKLGEGGMGEVYLAQDTKLKRQVAIKFLPEHLTKDKENVERFQREAEAAAALNHPNIVTIHDVIEENGHLCIVMEYIKGKSLRDVINEYKLGLEKIIDIISQICDGLSQAHQAGIVHRDIKPENIIVDKNARVKILDFGLAKLKGVSKLTKESSTLGTVHYMSPEQIQGKEVDQRSDIWSLGVLLYEMLTGEVPFQGEYEQAVTYAILNENPKRITQTRSDIPKNIEQIISKSLEKNRDKRYQNILDIVNDLQVHPDFELTPENQEKSIIALPFVNMSPDPDQEYFSDGLTEEIITDLSQIHNLLVISRSSAMTFKGTNKKVKEIAKEVNVQYVVEGSVRKVDNNLRITAQLINAETDIHMWAKKFDGTLDNVFDIQEKVSRSIVEALKIKLHIEEEKKITQHPIHDVQAFELYLKARQEIWKWTEDSMGRALLYLQNGLDIIGDNALLYFGMGYVYWTYINIGFKDKEECMREAEKYAEKIFEIEPNSEHGNLLM
jgi:serine/threonine protein kinase